jgi:putative transposase
VLTDHGIKVSMDGKVRWVDNVFVERLWRSVKYELVYLHTYESVTEAREQLAAYFEFYNGERPHSALGARTPDTAYFD